VLDGDPALTLKRGTAPTQFLAHVYCGQTAGWIKMPLGTEVNLGQCDVVRWGRSSPIFCPCLLGPNGWMDEDATWYGSRPGPKPHFVRRGPSSLRERGTAAPPLFLAHVYCGRGRPSRLLLSSCSDISFRMILPGNPPLGMKRKKGTGIAKYSDFGPIEGYRPISETVQDRRYVSINH